MRAEAFSFAALFLSLAVDVFCGQKASLRFFAIGDWGGLPVFPYKTFVEWGIAHQMGSLGDQLNVDFVIALGDNFYFNGVHSVDDPRFKKTFEEVFTAKSLQIPWLVLAGNHDHYGNVTAQIAYSKYSKRWYFPNFYYKRTFIIPATKTVVDILMLDTILLCGNTDPNDPYGQPLKKLRDSRASNLQLNWIEKNLQMSRANYLLVCGHFPVYSIAEHGSTQCLVNILLPLLQKYHVSAFLSGHDHNLQHIRPKSDNRTVEYFVIGSGDFIDPSRAHLNTIPPNSLQFTWANPFSLGGFAYGEITAKNMNLSFFESNGKLLYQHTLKPRY